MKNKYQEALDYIKHDLEHNDFIRYKNGNRVDKYHREVLRKLVGKETPMIPNGIKCGKCGSWVVENTRMGTIHFHRCRNIECEQKIDWSNNE